MTYLNLTYICLCLVLLNGCNIYSFSGASISEETKTVSISYIRNQANLIEPNLSNKLTEALIQKCQTETDLTIVDTAADINFSGKITQYEVQPISIQNNETAAQNRLTIGVEINYINNTNKTDNFNQLFTQYADFNSNTNFSEVEEMLNNLIIEEIVEDIFNRSFMNW
ncbi:MAG: hypothetical protein CMP56_00840 [Flavobacteriales bacterium]|nr:hypothetical protein [Flavobacteriales bacterium]